MVVMAEIITEEGRGGGDGGDHYRGGTSGVLRCVV